MAQLPQLNAALAEAEPLIASADGVSPGGVGYDDIAFFGRLRYVALVRGARCGPRLEAYLHRMSERCDVPLLLPC